MGDPVLTARRAESGVVQPSVQRRFLAALAVVLCVVLAAACTTSPPRSPHSSATVNAPRAQSPQAATAGSGLAWHSCQQKYECAALPVPLDYAHPAAGAISLALIRSRTTNTSGRIGSLLLNPGGPGVSTVDEFDGLVRSLSGTLRDRFDIVGFDPRGVGASAPVTCVDSAFLDRYYATDPAPQTVSGQEALARMQQQFAAGCTAHSARLLPFVGTASAARDMDAIRAALRDDRLTYLGFSYGTDLGATYADLFPTHVRALALDGPLDRTMPPFQMLRLQSDSFEANLQRFFGRCLAKPGECAWHPKGDAEAAYHALLARIAARPLPVANESRRLAVGNAIEGTLEAMYSTGFYGVLGDALAAAERGDGTELMQLSDAATERRPDGSYANLTAAYAAITCADNAWPTDPQAYFREADAAARPDPDVGAANALSSLMCAYWPVHAPHQPGPTVARGAPPILVIGTDHDPATPLPEAKSVAHQLQSGVLLTRHGYDHTAYAYSSCASHYIDAYLVNLATPPNGTSCPS